MEDNEWRHRLSAKAMIILCLSNEVLYNMMNEESTAALWCRLESLYLTKSLSNKLFMKKQLYSLRMKEGTPILQYLNGFNRILSNLLALEVKLEKENKTLLLLSFLPSSYDHLAITIMYDKKTLELEYVKQLLQNNELMKKTDSTKDALGLFVKGQKGRSNSRGPKGNPEAFSSFSCYFCKKSGHIMKNYMKYKEMLKRKGDKISDGVSTSGKSDQAGVVEEADDDSCDVLMVESGKDKYSDIWLLDLGCTYHMYPKREWFNTYKPYDRGFVLMEKDATCKTVGISNIHMRMFDG